MVEEHRASQALDELRRYEEENRAFGLRRALPPAAPLAREGTLAFGGVIVVLTLLQWRQAFGLDWLSAGRASASLIRAGELARTATALTLHVDVPHLVSNLVFGTLFTYLLLHALGGGIGLLAQLVAGMLGNLVNAWVHVGEHDSIGASTAVFAAIGLVAGSEARARHLLREPGARRFAPVGGALALVLYLGVDTAQTSNVDVLSHVFGFASGLALGFVLGALPRATLERRGLQAVAALTALLVLAGCWGLALT